MVGAFQHHEMEIGDLYSEVRELISYDEESLFDYILDHLKHCCPIAAKYIASLADIQPRCPEAPNVATQAKSIDLSLVSFARIVSNATLCLCGSHFVRLSESKSCVTWDCILEPLAHLRNHVPLTLIMSNVSIPS